MNMISMASSESTLAGLMSLSAPTSTSESSSPTSSVEDKQPIFKVPNPPEPPAPTRVSLSEYRAKHADELAAQKKKLENMEASVKREYATAAQALMNQQRKEKHHHNHHQQQASSSSSEPIVLKIPLEERQDRGSIKMRLTNSSRGAEPDLKLKLRIPERRSGAGEDGKSKEKHRERSNHHHHHHHNHHHHHSSGSGSSSSSTHKHSSSANTSSKKADLTRTSSSSSSSRKRTHASEPSSGAHPSKVSKLSRSSYQLPPLPADILPSLALAHNQGSFSHPKTDKADTNGHGANSGGQSNEYQDTFDMLNSLLSAQGVQPAQPQIFNYHSQYAEYRYGAGSRGGGNPQPPPLPSEPPPRLPPLPE